MTRALFVSDIHISSPKDRRAELFRRLLARLRENPPEHLFLVGDIFDLWIADRAYFLQAYAALIEDLVQLKNAGTQIHYFEGNHDLDLRLFWQHKLGFDVQGEAAFYDLYGLCVRVEHGDQMDPEDRGYLFLRWLLRTPVVRFLGRYLPNALVAWIGERASRTSRDYTSHVKVASDEQVRSKIRAHARAVYPVKAFDLLISGHVHVADDSYQEMPDGKKVRSVNTGTWLKQPLIFVLDAGGGRLVAVDEFLR